MSFWGKIMRAFGFSTNRACQVPPQLAADAKDREVQAIKQPAKEQRHNLKNQQQVLIGEVLQMHKRGR